MPGDQAQYFSATPSSRSRPRTVTLSLDDLTLELETDRGVFSPERIDPGTRYLLQTMPVPAMDEAPDLLDLGTGYGPIAITLARRIPTATVWATEVNERAGELCTANATRCGVNARVKVCHGVMDDLSLREVPEAIRFDAIYSNPPIRIGKNRLHELLLSALGRLKPDGSAYLVVNKHLGSDSLQRWLVTQGWPTQRRGSRAGYRVLEVSRTDH